MVIAVLVIVGLSLGSFVNALVWRLYIQQKSGYNVNRTSKFHIRKFNKRIGNEYSILTGQSMCPNCLHTLAPLDLIPVLSWLILQGKCRYCHQQISWQYPIVELLVTVLFVISYIFWPLGFNAVGIFSFVLWLLFLTAFTALSVYDLHWYLLPNRIVYPLIVTVIFEVLVKAIIFDGGWSAIIRAVWGLLIVAGLFYLLNKASNGAWIGYGDVKLGIMLGLLIGGPFMALLLIFLASVLGSIVSIPLLLKKMAKATTQIPFGPFLLTSAVIVVLFGAHITDWYNSFFYLR